MRKSIGLGRPSAPLVAAAIYVILVVALAAKYFIDFYSESPNEPLILAEFWILIAATLPLSFLYFFASSVLWQLGVPGDVTFFLWFGVSACFTALVIYWAGRLFMFMRKRLRHREALS